MILWLDIWDDDVKRLKPPENLDEKELVKDTLARPGPAEDHGEGAESVRINSE